MFCLCKSKVRLTHISRIVIFCRYKAETSFKAGATNITIIDKKKKNPNVAHLFSFNCLRSN